MKRFKVEQTQKSCKLKDNCVEMSTHAVLGGGGDLRLSTRIFGGCKNKNICYNSNVYHHNYNGELMKKIFGFTLAEVLITLGIIGVVAALTMPSLIANYQKKQASTAVKKVYSELSQALKLAELDYGQLEDWPLLQSGTLESNREFINTYISPYYKGLQIVSEGYDPNWGDNKGVSNGVSSVGINTITSNGTILSITQAIKSIVIVVDINGYKKPNIVGRDIFYFNTLTGKLMPSGWQDGLTRDMILSGYTSENGLTFSCKKVKNSEDDDYTDYRHGCTALLMIDGWEFKNDYPW